VFPAAGLGSHLPIGAAYAQHKLHMLDLRKSDLLLMSLHQERWVSKSVSHI